MCSALQKPVASRLKAMMWEAKSAIQLSGVLLLAVNLYISAGAAQHNAHWAWLIVWQRCNRCVWYWGDAAGVGAAVTAQVPLYWCSWALPFKLWGQWLSYSTVPGVCSCCIEHQDSNCLIALGKRLWCRSFPSPLAWAIGSDSMHLPRYPPAF